MERPSKTSKNSMDVKMHSQEMLENSKELLNEITSKSSKRVKQNEGILNLSGKNSGKSSKKVMMELEE